jgi:uncharacterized RDD family membrane protein YckC
MKANRTIEIPTTQHVSIEYELATLAERLFALLLDFVIILILWLGFAFLIEGTGIANYAGNWIHAVVGFFPLYSFVFYCLLLEVFMDGQTIGKRAMSIRAVRLDGREPAFSDYIIRAVFQIGDSLLSLGVVGALLIGFTDKRQRLGDLAANTTVVKAKISYRFRLEDILGISTLENYTPSFYQVRQLTEGDVILIKSVVDRCQRYPNDAHQEALLELSEKLRERLDIPDVPRDAIQFLKTLIRDYIVLTR